MPASVSIAGDVAGAAAALAGLILVFFAAALSSFDNYNATQKASVRTRYRLRAWPAFVAFVLALASSGLALHAKATMCAGTAIASIWLLAIVGVGIFVSALMAVRDIG